MKWLVIRPDGKVTEHNDPTIDAGDRTVLEILQATVKGYIESVSTSIPDTTAFINEEGKLSDPPLKYNAVATRLCPDLWGGDYIAGPMVLLGPVDSRGATTSLPDSAVNLLHALGVATEAA